MNSTIKGCTVPALVLFFACVLLVLAIVMDVRQRVLRQSKCKNDNIVVVKDCCVADGIEPSHQSAAAKSSSFIQSIPGKIQQGKETLRSLARSDGSNPPDTPDITAGDESVRTEPIDGVKDPVMDPQLPDAAGRKPRIDKEGEMPITISNFLTMGAIIFIALGMWVVSRAESSAYPKNAPPISRSPSLCPETASIPAYCRALENTLNRLYWAQTRKGGKQPSEFIHSLFGELQESLTPLSDTDRNKVLSAFSRLENEVKNKTVVVDLNEWSKALLGDIQSALNISYKLPDREVFSMEWYGKQGSFKSIEQLADGDLIDLVNPAWYWGGQLMSKGTICIKV